MSKVKKTLQNPKRIKDTRSMTGGHISRFSYISHIKFIKDDISCN